MNIRHLGTQDYSDVWIQMKEFTLNRTTETNDEIWLLQHFPVYTQGQAGKAEHIINNLTIPIVQSDRGGQVTYHGPGQLVVYILMDIAKRNMGIRTLVSTLEKIIMSVLSEFQIESNTQCGAPGVYVLEQKIASIGLRVKNGCTYHGIALNIDMDLSPFLGINPCGFANMKMTQMSHFRPEITMEQVDDYFIQQFLTYFKQ